MVVVKYASNCFRTVYIVIVCSDSIGDQTTDKALEFIAQTASKKPAADKVGVVVFGRHAAVELPPRITLPLDEGITVNSICPGLVITDIVKSNGPATAATMGMSFDEMIAMFAQDSAIKRPNTAEEVAALAVLLASEAGSGITGAILSVDGGSTPY